MPAVPMPELPEVEVIRRGLAPLLTGRRVEAVATGDKPLRLPMPVNGLRRWVKNGRIEEVRRRAKYLALVIDNGALLLIHLGMTGRLGLFDGKSPGQRHDHLRITLDNGMELRFNDARRFGSVQVLPTRREQENFFARLGPEPLHNEFSPSYLLDKAGKRKQPVKNFLMDGRVAAGIGNIYANEILFGAGISPARAAHDLSLEQWLEVTRACRRILAEAIAAGGSTIADFVNFDGAAGKFQHKLQVYGRAGHPCRKCGVPVQRTVMAGRATYFCPTCQR